MMTKRNTCVWIVSTVSNNFAIFILHLSDLIITIIAIGVLFIGVSTPTHRTTQVKQTMKSMLKTMETTLAIMLSSPQKTMAMAT
jgi:hypothetical protein